ncbi:5'-3' exonuclease [Virgibacillus halophilus]|uniref:5'-3' exonuclease n=1 Tax=Tigheibacillus halophilus TaxID=361280 RepID=A0ABU5CCC5_9BACI|nr:5'-3' exonuclease [Virgibacillus halophilus]
MVWHSYSGGFYATAIRKNFMRTISGVPTNGVYQFLRYLMDAMETFGPTHIICCWDMGSKTFRTDMFEGYKANRGAPPEELVPQFDLVKEVVDALGIQNVGLANYEADDCIGTIAKRYASSYDITILTGDQDILQLVSQNIAVAIMRKGQGNYEVFTADNFYEKRGISPKQVIDMKGLMGDTADNYPGVKGIGEKTAMKLLAEHETIDMLLEHVDKLPMSLQTKIKNNMDMLHLSRNLAEIKCDVPLECEIEKAKWLFEREKTIEKFREMELEKLTRLLG